MPNHVPAVVELADPDTWPVEFDELARRIAAAGRLEERALSGEIDDPPFIRALGGLGSGRTTARA
jgi:hypothetical protein